MFSISLIKVHFWFRLKAVTFHILAAIFVTTPTLSFICKLILMVLNELKTTRPLSSSHVRQLSFRQSETLDRYQASDWSTLYSVYLPVFSLSNSAFLQWNNYEIGDCRNTVHDWLKEGSCLDTLNQYWGNKSWICESVDGISC